MEIIIGWVILSVAVAFYAESRGRSGGGFLLLSLIFSPILAFVIVVVTKDLKQEARDIKQREYEDQKRHEEHLASIRAVSHASRADELEKLASLRDRGVISAEEFEMQKRSLLA